MIKSSYLKKSLENQKSENAELTYIHFHFLILIVNLTGKPRCFFLVDGL
ncbi:MAG: hypothetical protein CM1200mP28_12510 [Deltaproteobacteria bacterium]|nr:MAG: hypothetical protein CM1200mP28_12510 [Deltaproteobacteria bacterium]